MLPISEQDEGHDSGEWLAVFGANVGENSARGRLFLHRHSGNLHSSSPQAEERGIVFAGILYNREELRTHFASRLPAECTDEDIVRLAYDEWGENALLRFRGVFALIIWDSLRNRLLCARDPAGLHPLFYAEAGRSLVLSPSIDSILRHPGVPRELNRPALVDHLARRWLHGEETYFARVKRVLPCHAMLVCDNSRTVYRYWDPLPPTTETGWIPEGEAGERFDDALRQAVHRGLAIGHTGISLSGGVDSTAVAMIATDLCRRDGREDPWALSIVLPGPHVDEAASQRDVASALGLRHLQLPFDAATGTDGALAATLAMSSTMPAPVSSVLRPALCRMANEARQRGCQAILTGDGADEWVGGNQYLAADLLRSMDIGGVYRFWRTLSRSFPPTIEVPLRSVLWRWGARPLLRDAVYESAGWALARRIAPGTLRNLRRRRSVRMRPPWLVSDAALGLEVDRREIGLWESLQAPSRIRSQSLRFARLTLDLPQKWMFHEETFHLARRNGVHVVQPFWDADLIECVMKIRPQTRVRDGYTKYLLRRSLARRFPGLDFERRLKSYTGNVILSSIATGAAAVRRALGGTLLLSELGVVDARRAAALFDCDAVNLPDSDRMRLLEILNLETWVRAHSAVSHG